MSAEEFDTPIFFFEMLEASEAREDFFQVGKIWSASSKEVQGAVGLLSYRTHHNFKLSSGSSYMKYSCTFQNCPATINFNLRQHVPPSWCVTRNIPHSQECVDFLSDPENCRKRWEVKPKTKGTLIPTSVLAQISSVKLSERGLLLPDLEPKTVGKILKDLKLLPPFQGLGRTTRPIF
jgi:hypothetical protein